MREVYFYFVWKYIHLYPTWEQSPAVLWTADMVKQQGCGISPATLRDQVLAYLVALALAIDEIHWEDRLDAFNHTEHMQTRFTAMLDTAPLVINDPVGKINKHTFQPKYKASCFKMQVALPQRCAEISVVIQIAIDLLCNIVLYTGLHWGVSPDNHIWRWTSEQHPLESYELVLADGIYKGQYLHAVCVCTHIYMQVRSS